MALHVTMISAVRRALPPADISLGEVWIVADPVALPSAPDALDKLPHVEWRTGWKDSMWKPLEELQQIAKTVGVSNLMCTLCEKSHGLEHSTGPKHYDRVWRLKHELVQRGCGYEEGRDRFWQPFVGHQAVLRYNHLDGAIEIWTPTAETASLMQLSPTALTQQLERPLPPPPPPTHPGDGRLSQPPPPPPTDPGWSSPGRLPELEAPPASWAGSTAQASQPQVGAESLRMK